MMTGRIVDKNGKGVSGLEIDIFAKGVKELDNGETDDQGNYSFSHDEENGKRLDIVIRKNRAEIYSGSHQITGHLAVPDIVLKSGPPSLLITGYVQNQRGEPVAGAGVSLFAVKDGVEHQVVGEPQSSSANGRFEFTSLEPEKDDSLRIVVKKGPDKARHDIRRGKETEIVIKIGEKPVWLLEAIVRWWKAASWGHRALAVGVPIVLILLIWVLVPPRLTQVRVVLKSPNTNATLTLTSSQRVSRVSVRLNEESEQAFTKLKRNPVVDVPPTLNFLRFAIIRINDQEPQTYVFMTDNGRKVEDAAKRFKESFVAIERMCIAMTTLADLAKRPRPDAVAKQRADDALDYWKREYSAQLTALLRDYPPDVTKLAAERFRPGGPTPEQQAFFSPISAVMGRHLSAIKAKGKIPNGFENELYAEYQKLPKGIKIE